MKDATTTTKTATATKTATTTTTVTASTPATATQQILDRLVLAHENCFDITAPFSLGGVDFDAMAAFHQSAEKYVLSKKAKIWGYSTHEYIFFKQATFLGLPQLDDLVERVESSGMSLVRPDDDHMASYLTLVVVAAECEAGIPRHVKRTRFRKNLALGFKGWVDLRVAVVDVGGKQIYTNGQGKVLRDTLEANSFRPSRDLA